jgi:hypothetical protein
LKLNKIKIIEQFPDEKKMKISLLEIKGRYVAEIISDKIEISNVGDCSEYTSKNLRDFIYESNNTGRISFVNSFNEAIIKLVHSS